MSIQGIVAGIKEANNISGNRSYGNCQYREADPRMEIWKLEAEYLARKAKEKNDPTTTT